MSSRRFPPELVVLASAPSSYPLFDVGGQIPLVALSTSFGRRQNGLSEKEEKGPAILCFNILGDAVGDLGK